MVISTRQVKLPLFGKLLGCESSHALLVEFKRVNTFRLKMLFVSYNKKYSTYSSRPLCISPYSMQSAVDPGAFSPCMLDLNLRNELT